MATTIEVKVTHRDRTMGTGVFHKGTVATLDLQYMQVHHLGVEWDVVRSGAGYKLGGFETYFDIVQGD